MIFEGEEGGIFLEKFVSGARYAQYSTFLTKNIAFQKLIGLDLSVDRY